MPRPRRSIELELKITELLMGDHPLAQIAEQTGITEAALGNILHSIYKQHRIDGRTAGKRERLQTKLRHTRPRVRLWEREAKVRPQAALDDMTWQERFWAAYEAVVALEAEAENDGLGGNRYFREAL